MKKIVVQNKKARHDYFIEDTYEAGIELFGTEIKAIRKGSAQLKDSYVDFINGQAFIKGMYIGPYDKGNRFNHEELRDRRLLLHKQEIRKLADKVKIKGYTVVPLELYLNDGLAKLLIGLAKDRDIIPQNNDQEDIINQRSTVGGKKKRRKIKFDDDE